MVANRRRGDRPKVAAIEASRVVRGSNPEGSDADLVLTKRPRVQWSALCVGPDRSRIRNFAPIDYQPTLRNFDYIARFRDDRLEKRCGAIRTVASVSIAANDRKSCIGFRWAKFNKARTRVRSGYIEPDGERRRGIDAQAETSRHLEETEQNNQAECK